MKRRHLTKAELIKRMHRGLRPKLAADQVKDLSLVHLQNLDAIARGDAGEQILWDWVGGLFTWSRAATLIDLGVPEIEPQLQLAAAVIERYGRTGKIVFTGLEYQLAKDGVVVMDLLASQVDQANASAAADWSEAKVQQLADQCAARQGLIMSSTKSAAAIEKLRSQPPIIAQEAKA